MDNIYFNSLLTKKINIESRYLDENIDNYIEKCLKNKVEGYCIDEGYVEPDSLKIITKSVGSLLGSRFTGDVTYNIAYTANVCNPIIGNVIDCKVKFINKIGLLGNNGPLTILIPRYVQDENENMNKINENDIVKIEIIAKKFYLNSKEIKIVGKIWNNEEKDKKIIKKNFISSDLTPINNEDDIENEFLLNEDDDKNELSDNELDDLSLNSDEEEEEDEDEEMKDLHNIENPDENNLEDIEIDEDDDYEDDDIESQEDF